MHINKTIRSFIAMTATLSLSLLTMLVLYTEKAEAKISNKSAKAIEILRMSKKERKARDEARKTQDFRSRATIIRVLNKSTDSDIDSHLVPVVENQLRALGFRVKDYRITKAIVEKKSFKGFNSSEGLKILGEYLKTNVLVFLTVDKCLVSTFADELHEHISSGHISIPDREFVEIQVKMSIFDVVKKEVVFTHSDRQFIPLKSVPGCPELQEVFHTALHNCVSNLLITMRPQHFVKKYD